MARNPKIEKILEAWWELDHCEPPRRAKAETNLNGGMAFIERRHEIFGPVSGLTKGHSWGKLSP